MLSPSPCRRCSPRPSRAPLRGRGQSESGKSKPCRSQPRPFRTPRCPRKTLQKTVCVDANFRRCDQSNQQYSVTALTDTTGTISERYAYDAYGNLTVTDGAGTSISGSAYGNRYTYTGREWDGELGLYHYRARMYDPVAGRFCSHDPIGYTGGFSLFEYVHANPLIRSDPTGLAEVNFSPNPWNTPIPWINTTFLPPFDLKGLEGLTAPDEAFIECECGKTDDSSMFAMRCTVQITISKIYIRADADEALKPWIYRHEQLHIRNYSLMARHYGNLLEEVESELFCRTEECEDRKRSVLDTVIEWLQTDMDQEALHLNFPHPAKGNKYPPDPNSPMPEDPQNDGVFPPLQNPLRPEGDGERNNADTNPLRP